MDRATLTLSIPPKLKKEMKAFKDVNWSGVARRLLENHIQRLKVLKRLDELTKNSTLTMEDTIELGREVNKRVAERHGIVVKH